MDDNKNRLRTPGGIYIPIISLFFIAFAILPGCSPRIVENTRTEYVYRDRVQVDTTWLRDSVYIKEWTAGDTVRIVEHRDHLVYQYKMLRDTVSLVDSVIVDRIKEVKVEKPLTWSQKAKIGLFPWLLLAVIGLLVWTFRKPLLGLITK